MKKNILESLSNNSAKLIKLLLIIILIPLFTAISVPEIEAAPKKKSYSSVKKKAKKSRRSKRRTYKKEQTRQEAIQVILDNSEEVARLAGLKAMLDSVRQYNAEPDLLTIGDNGEDIAELTEEDDVSVDLEQFNTLWLDFAAVDGQVYGFDLTEGGFSKEELMLQIMDWLGTPYRFGGSSRKAIDCSAFTQRVFLETFDVLIPRTARAQYTVGDVIEEFDGLKFGDLVFFHTYTRRYASHVGIYLGDMLFAHASSRNGVTVSSLESTFYNKRFIGGRRLQQADIASMSIKKEDTLVAN